MKKKIWILIIILTNFLLTVNPNEKNEITLHKIAIIPLYNISNAALNPEISILIYKAVSSAIEKSHNFSLTTKEQIESELINYKISYKSYLFQDTALIIGNLFKLDILIYGFYKIINQKLKIYVNVINVKETKSLINFEEAFLMDDNLTGELINFSNRIINIITEKYINLKNIQLVKEKPKIKSNRFQTAGISLSAVGGTLLLAGTILFIYDRAVYSQHVMDLQIVKTKDDYYNFIKAYQINVALFSCGLSMLIIGSALFTTGLTMIFYKNNKKEMSFFIEPKPFITFGIKQKF